MKYKTKVLTWLARNGGTAQQVLDDWLSQNDIELVDVTQSESGDVTASRRITWTIWYK